ncbi:uncharacterized protein N7443_010678 [Penicillium atrosanguineum]|uniref:uncharacterized protein n=1 Tax=Penicillium atrosanguineum TaxID=1132637 RepID=UPI002383EF48|nr:uncharacterized protein N7443_010678 [Penicillium atrosanguineum]KAJ5290425.1 hypothetical protein N7443_010678 [Penicillium atrosanguineum]
MKSHKIPSPCNYLSTTRCVSSIARDSQTMRLPDGRTLGFAECGRNGDYPLMFMHGYPSCRLETLGMDEIAHRHNIRIITPDRNGYGLTTFNPNLRIRDWPADIQALARHLNLERFAILGGSGGSPYALACAHLLPHNTLSGVGIMAGAGPWEAGAHHMSLPHRISALAAHYWPLGYGGLLSWLVWMLRRALSSPSGARRIDKWLDDRSSKLDSKDATNVRREVIARQVLEAFRQGTAPAVHDAQLLTSIWGIEFEDVTYDKVRIWHGAQDANTPVQMVRYMAERLPHCELQEFKDDTHFTLHRHLDRILTELVPEHSRTPIELTDR